MRGLCYFAFSSSSTSTASTAAAAATAVLADDTLRLAAVCRLLLAAREAPAATAEPGAAGTRQALLFCSYAAGGSSRVAAGTGALQQQVLVQAQRLVALCLAALAGRAAPLAASPPALQLQQPRLGLDAAAAAASPVPPLVETVLLLTTNESWAPAMGSPAAAAEATAQVLASAADSGLFVQLVAIGAAARAQGDTLLAPAAAAAADKQVAVPSGEAVVTALTVRCLAQQQAVMQRQQQQHQQQPRSRQALPVNLQLPLLLCLPLLLRRLPTLKPLAARLWRHAVAALHTLPAPELAVWLQALPGPPGATAAALLGNLLEGAAAALRADAQQQQQQPATTREAALQLAGLASTLLVLVPLPFFAGSGGRSGAGSGSSRWVEDEDEDERGGQHFPVAVTAAAAGVVRLAWDPEVPPSPGVVAQLQLVSNSTLLRAVVGAVLPCASLGDGSSGSAVQQPSLQQRAADVRQLCRLLQQLMAMPGQRQRLLVTLAFSAELVPRLWFSYLRPALAAPGECNLQNSGGGGGGGGNAWGITDQHMQVHVDTTFLSCAILAVHAMMQRKDGSWPLLTAAAIQAGCCRSPFSVWRSVHSS